MVIKNNTPYSLNKSNYKKVLDLLKNDLTSQEDEIGERVEGSGWTLYRYLYFTIDIFKIRPIRASSYIPTPEKYANAKCGLINIKNEDQQCFKWCMKYHQTKKEKHDDRLTVLHKIEDKYDYSCITFPASYEDIEKFEEINKVCIFIYTIEQEGIITDKKGNGNYIMNDCIYLLRIENQEQSHYVYIKHIDRLFNLHHHIQDKDKRFCPICTNKVNISEYGSHVSQCYKFAKNSTLLELSPGEMKFKKHKNKLERPFIVYADLEGTLIKIVDIEKLAMHKANSACFYFVCTFDNSRNRLWHYVGEDCVYQMIIELNKLAEECIAEMKENKRMIMTPEDEIDFANSEFCHICSGKLGDECKKKHHIWARPCAK